MIKYTKGDLFKSTVEALVNPVNTVGVMGKGLALAFKNKFKENFKLYKIACESGECKIGKVFITSVKQNISPAFIVNFPTKAHWRNASKYEYISDGLEDLITQVETLKIKSIAIPPLGCGNGGLEWRKVKSMIEEAFVNLPKVEVLVFEP